MPQFTSKRERNLWALTVIVVFTILATLGLVGKLFGLFSNQRFVEKAMFGGFVILVTSILILNLRFRPSCLEIGAALGVIAVYMMSFLRIASPAERTHLFEYSLVGMLIYHALRERATNGRKVYPNVAILGLVITFAIGTLDESIQYFLPNRVFDAIDILFNLLAASIGVFGSVIITHARKWLIGIFNR